MKAVLQKISLEPGEFFASREWQVPRFSLPWHYHPECELTLITKGRGTRYVGDRVERFREGDLVFLGSNLPHYWWTDADDPHPEGRCFVIVFDEYFLGENFLRRPEAAPLRRLFSRSRRGLVFPPSVRAQAAEKIIRLNALSGLKALRGFLEILDLLASALRPRPLASENFPHQPEEDGTRLAAVFKYVHESYQEEIREKHAAALTGLGIAAFSRLFHRQAGLTFVGYVIAVRVSQACRRLAESDLTITEIAFETGFNNLTNFNRHFRNLKGVTPTEYRRRYLTS